MSPIRSDTPVATIYWHYYLLKNGQGLNEWRKLKNLPWNYLKSFWLGGTKKWTSCSVCWERRLSCRGCFQQKRRLRSHRCWTSCFHLSFFHFLLVYFHRGKAMATNPESEMIFTQLSKTSTWKNGSTFVVKLPNVYVWKKCGVRQPCRRSNHRAQVCQAICFHHKTLNTLKFLPYSNKWGSL